MTKLVDEKKTANAVRELIRDVIFLGGAALLTAGVKLEFGWGWALITLGVLCLSLVFWPMRSRDVA